MPNPESPPPDSPPPPQTDPEPFRLLSGHVLAWLVLLGAFGLALAVASLVGWL